MAFIANQRKIESTVTQVFENISSPTCEGEANRARHRESLAAEYRRDDRGRIVCGRDSKGTMFCRGVECRTRNEPVYFRQHDLKLLQYTFALWRWFITLRGPHQQVIMKRIPHSLQRAAHRWLAQQQPLGGTGYVTLFGEHREHNQEIQVSLT